MPIDLPFVESIELRNKYAGILKEHRDEIVERWMKKLSDSYPELEDTTDIDFLKETSCGYLQRLGSFVVKESNKVDILEDPPFKSYLDEKIEFYVKQGMPAYIPAAYFLFLKDIMNELLNNNFFHADPTFLLASLELNTGLIEPLAHTSCKSFVEYRETMIKQQAKAIDELSTPVIQLWDGILALPLIGTIDSARAKQVMENLLNEIVKTKSSQVVIDITGVPIVDTGVASRLMRTVEAARLLGTECILTGISPVIAQTLVTVGINLGSIQTRATLKNGLESALNNLNMEIVTIGKGDLR
ncbi:MAG TPA: STAS domain-containing protein [Desulfitobacteriaceae bacterium]|nr:STAS domain-containing protein [Desulfitobacteriaceae bacterium]